MNIQKIMSSLEAKHPGESEYLQAVKEVLLSIEEPAVSGKRDMPTICSTMAPEKSNTVVGDAVF